MEEDEDDLYGTVAATNGFLQHPQQQKNGNNVEVKQEEPMDEDVDDDDDDEDSESDIDIITERENAPAQPPSQDFQRVKQEPVRISSAPESSVQKGQQPAQIKAETPAAGTKLTVRDGSKYPEFRISSIDLDNIPVYEPAGKPITEVDLDADVAMETKPWRVPGTDPTDFFNYGFDEFTWVQYCMKHNQMKENVSQMKNDTKQFENILSGQPQGMPQMPAMPAMPGMPDMNNPEMMAAMMQSMQSQGVSDPSQMDFGSFMQQMQAMGGMPGMPPMPGFGAGQQNGGSQGFGGNFGGQNMQQQGSNQGFVNQQQGQGFGGGTPQPQQQAMDGYSSQQLAMLQQQGGNGGRGRGRGRRW